MLLGVTDQAIMFSIKNNLLIIFKCKKLIYK